MVIASDSEEAGNLCLLTPPPWYPILRGTTQQALFEVARAKGYDCSGAVSYALHGGGLFPDRGFAPAVGASAGILARLNRWVFLQLDLGLLLSFEQRQRSGAALGFLPLFSAGAEL